MRGRALTANRRMAHDPDVEGNRAGRLGTWRRQAQRLQTEALVFYFVFKHPRVTWFARWIAACIAVYLLSPVQLIPSYIPVIGFLDDLLVLFLGVKVLRRIIPNDILAECRQRAKVVATRRKEKIRSVGATVGLVAVVSLWLVGTVLASTLIVEYIHHHRIDNDLPVTLRPSPLRRQAGGQGDAAGFASLSCGAVRHRQRV